jgi:hypothetical protein
MDEMIATLLQKLGAGAFGALIGWYVYYVNRYRRGDVQLSDLVTLVGVIGGAGILSIFPAGTDLFGAYGVGLAAGFFGYFIALLILVRISKNFTLDWFLDGRRRNVQEGFYIPAEVQAGVRPGMSLSPSGSSKGSTREASPGASASASSEDRARETSQGVATEEKD